MNKDAKGREYYGDSEVLKFGAFIYKNQWTNNMNEDFKEWQASSKEKKEFTDFLATKYNNVSQMQFDLAWQLYQLQKKLEKVK